MSKKESQKIAKNRAAFISNFGPVKIEKEENGRGFYVYSPIDAKSYVQYCENIDYLNGWLYGCVQMACHCLKPLEQKQSFSLSKSREWVVQQFNLGDCLGLVALKIIAFTDEFEYINQLIAESWDVCDSVHEDEDAYHKNVTDLFIKYGFEFKENGELA